MSGADRRETRKCPICRKPATTEAFPFCSTRCADVDLNRWFSGAYVIPAEPAGAEEEAEERDAP